jgi:hypothetical protein
VVRGFLRGGGASFRAASAVGKSRRALRLLFGRSLEMVDFISGNGAHRGSRKLKKKKALLRSRALPLSCPRKTHTHTHTNQQKRNTQRVENTVSKTETNQLQRCECLDNYFRSRLQEFSLVFGYLRMRSLRHHGSSLHETLAEPEKKVTQRKRIVTTSIYYNKRTKCKTTLIFGKQSVWK